MSADKLHGRGGIVHLALQSIGQKPNDRHVILVTHEDSGVAVWNFRYVSALAALPISDCNARWQPSFPTMGLVLRK